MRSKHAILLFALVLAAGCGRIGSSRAKDVQVEQERQTLWARATVAPAAAMRTALARVPGGRISKAELEEEDGRLVYSFDIRVPGRDGEDEVQVDARTGAIVKFKHEG
jgi:uncharacterized membrane protein YkoI